MRRTTTFPLAVLLSMFSTGAIPAAGADGPRPATDIEIDTEGLGFGD